MRQYATYQAFNAVTPQTVTSSTDATPIVVTKTSHGYSTGDLIAIYGHTTNVAANGIRKITVLSSSTFSLQDPYTGANIAGSGGGSGSGGVMSTASKVMLTPDFRHLELQVDTASSANMTIQIMGSQGRMTPSADTGAPVFGATQSAANPWTFIDLIDLADGSSIAGATGIAPTGTDIHKNYEINVNGIMWICPMVTAWTAGSVSIKAALFNDTN